MASRDRPPGACRTSAGSTDATNPTRPVILGGGRWNSIDGLETLVLPKDDCNLIATVHYYTPMEFTHQGAPWNKENKDKSGVPWTGTDQERRRIELDFAKAQQWAVEHDRPLLLGEFGAYDKADMDSRARYTAAVARTDAAPRALRRQAAAASPSRGAACARRRATAS